MNSVMISFCQQTYKYILEEELREGQEMGNVLEERSTRNRVECEWKERKQIEI